ncbi:response regulator transcription factor [Polymorphospora rubra]|uniref:response regulator transcription factor n=1 Tax=Polymorphospora rubra TaxID=338584 RepID=UPI0031E418B1
MGVIPVHVSTDLPRMRRAAPDAGDISVLLADDHALFAEALQTRLSREPDLRPVRVAYNAEQVRARISRDHPAVLVLDMAFSNDSAVALAGFAREASPTTRVVMLTGVDAPNSVVSALQGGVRAWLPKTVKPEQLVRAIRGVTRGEAWVPPDVLGQVLNTLVGLEPQQADPLAVLTPREREVLQAMVDGFSRVQIAARLHLSTNTVRTHTQNMLSKLGVHSTLESVALALRSGMRATDH